MGLLDRLGSIGRLAAERALERVEQALMPEVDDDVEILKAEKEEDEKKLGSGIPTEPPEDGPDALLEDPYALLRQMGYKDRPNPIAFATIRQAIRALPIQRAIIQVRLSQVKAFARRPETPFDTGFRIRPKDKDAKLTAADRKFAHNVEELFIRSGVKMRDGSKRDGMEAFTQKFVQDSLFYDQACAEIVENRKHQPAAWYAVDATTIRLADNYRGFLDHDPEAIKTVQVYNNVVVRQWRANQMIFHVRNPSTSIYSYGYGESEVEMCFRAITDLLNAFTYNGKAFSNGALVKGLLNIKGTQNQKMLRAFRREWFMMVSGLINAWRTPVLNADEVQYIDLHQNNRDMEFSNYADFLIKVCCGVNLIDAMEVGFKYGNSGQERSMFESGNKQKLVDSKDKGLKPILRGIATKWTEDIVDRIDDEWEATFVGLDMPTLVERADLDLKRTKSTHTPNEVRAELNLEPLEYGDILLDSVYLQAKQAAEGQQQQGGPGGQPGQPGQPGGEEGGEPPNADNEEAPGMDDEQMAALLGRDSEPEEEPERKRQAVRKSGRLWMDVSI